MKRCEELQAGAEQGAKVSESITSSISNGGEDKQAFVEKLQKQLGAKNSKLQKLNNVVHQLEQKIASLMRGNVAESRGSSSQDQTGHQVQQLDQTKQQIKQLIDRVQALKQQKHQLQSELSRYRENRQTTLAQVKEMEEELQRERERMQNMSKQLANYKRKEQQQQQQGGSSSSRESSSSSSSRESCKAKLENQVRHLNSKLAKVEQQVREMNREKEAMASMMKKEVRDGCTNIEIDLLGFTNIEADFLGALASSSKSSNNSERAGPCCEKASRESSGRETSSTEKASGFEKSSSSRDTSASDERAYRENSSGYERAPWEDDAANEKQSILKDKQALEGRMKQDLKGSEMVRRSLEQELRSSEMMRRSLEQELRSSEKRGRSLEQEVLDLNEEVRRLRDPSNLEEGARIAKLVSAMEELEDENRDLRRVIAVDKEEHIGRLEKEKKKLSESKEEETGKLEKELQALRAQVKRIPTGVSQFGGGVFNPRLQELEKTLGEKDRVILELERDQASRVEELEKIISEKDRLLLELGFQHDQARRELSEVETRYDILFKEWVEENTHKMARKAKPILGPLPKAGSRNTGEAPGKENELELLVFTLKRVVDKLRKENSKLKQAGLSENRYQRLLKKNTELKSTIDRLSFKIASYGKASPQGQVPILESRIEELTEDLQTLTDVNAELIHVLKQAEEIYPDIKPKLRKKTGTPFDGVKYFGDRTRYENALVKQRREISRLQDELNTTLQLNNDLMYQLAKREDELDFVHGKLCVRDLIGTEGVKKRLGEARNPRELKSHATTVINNGCFEVLPGDNRKELEGYDAELVDEFEDLRHKHHDLTEICKHYEKLLLKYTDQLQVPFRPLTYSSENLESFL